MKLSDIITLAKQGYKPADIRELISIAEDSEPEPQPEPQPEVNPDISIEENEKSTNPSIPKPEETMEYWRGEYEQAVKDKFVNETNEDVAPEAPQSVNEILTNFIKDL